MMQPVPPLDLWAVPLRGSRLLEASAGTGKTWTLSALVVRLVLGEGTDADYVRPLWPSELLVMTFTRAATRELTDRIRQRLAQAARVLRQAPDAGTLCAKDRFLAELSARYATGNLAGSDLSREQAAWRVAQAAECMDEAAIFTLDAWCQRVLREHAFDSGQLFDENLLPDEAPLLREAVRDHWRLQVYPLPIPRLVALQQETSAFRSVDNLAKDVSALLQSPVPLLQPAGLHLSPDADGLGLGELLEQVWQARRSVVAPWQARCVQPFQALADWLAVQTDSAKADWDLRKLAARHVLPWAQVLVDWAQRPDETGAPLLTDAARTRLSPDGLAQARKAGSPPLCLPPLVAQALDAWPQIEAAVAQAPGLAAAARAHAAAQVRLRMAHLKSRQGLFGFADLPRRLAAALADPEHGERLRAHIVARYPVALIDEFQDTSPLQMQLLDRLYRVEANDPNHALLLIGDPKQSIYAFRGADIHSYLKARMATSGRHHVLGVNHRSSAAMVQAINHLFGWREQAPQGSGAFRMGAGHLAESPVPFVPVACQGRAERWRVSGQPAPAITLAHDLKLGNSENHRRAFAERCAQQVVQWLSDPATGFEGTGLGWQCLRPGDVAVLVRTGTEAAAVRRALARRGVASVYVSDRDSVYQSPEAADLLRWLQAVAQPRDVRLARAAWGTRLAALSLDELQTLAQDDDVLDARMAQLAQLHTVWQQRGVLALVRQSLFEAQWPQRWLAQPDGERRLTNVLHLAELLQSASAGLKGEASLIRWLSTQMHTEHPEGDAPLVRLESDRHLVQIVTIHSSKGLEYPIVLLPFATLHRKADRSVTEALRPLASSDPHGAQWAMTLTPDVEDKARVDELRLAEDLRLLYVAVTRAQHALWVGFAAIGAEKDNDPDVDETHRSALGYLVGGDAPPAAGWLTQLEDLAGASPTEAGVPVWRIEPATDAPVTVWQPNEAPMVLQPPRSVDHRFDTHWTPASFSRLTRDLGHPEQTNPSDASGLLPFGHQPAADEFLRSDEGFSLVSQAQIASVSGADGDVRHRFLRGPQGGNFLHEQMEWLAQEGFALARRPDLAGQLRKRCERQGKGAQSEGLVTWLAEVCEHPLPAVGAALADLASPLPEMAFWLPSRCLHPLAVGELCRQHLLVPLAAWAGQPQLAEPDRVRPLPDSELQGLLLGFVDLVFAHQGRHWVLDYKSNHLGDDDAAYTPAALVRTMVHHRYDVQAALYTLALHRLLRTRLGAGYQPGLQLGGACWLFLRGLRGPAQGVCHMPMPLALLDALEAML